MLYSFLKKEVKVKAKEATGMGTVILTSFVIKAIADYPINFFVVGFYGYFFSVLIMAIINFLICYIFVRIYDFYKIDILFIEEFKQNKEINNKIIDFIKKWSEKGKIILFLVLSIKNPFIMVIYFRKGHFNGFKEKDIKILTTISIIGTSILWNTFIYLCFYVLESSKHFKTALF